MQEMAEYNNDLPQQKSFLDPGFQKLNYFKETAVKDGIRREGKRGTEKKYIRHSHLILKQPNTQMNVLLLLFAFLKGVMNNNLFQRQKFFTNILF